MNDCKLWGHVSSDDHKCDFPCQSRRRILSPVASSYSYPNKKLMLWLRTIAFLIVPNISDNYFLNHKVRGQSPLVCMNVSRTETFAFCLLWIFNYFEKKKRYITCNEVEFALSCSVVCWIKFSMISKIVWFNKLSQTFIFKWRWYLVLYWFVLYSKRLYCQFY